MADVDYLNRVLEFFFLVNDFCKLASYPNHKGDLTPITHTDAHTHAHAHIHIDTHEHGAHKTLSHTGDIALIVIHCCRLRS